MFNSVSSVPPTKASTHWALGENVLKELVTPREGAECGVPGRPVSAQVGEAGLARAKQTSGPAVLGVVRVADLGRYTSDARLRVLLLPANVSQDHGHTRGHPASTSHSRALDLCLSPPPTFGTVLGSQLKNTLFVNDNPQIAHRSISWGQESVHCHNTAVLCVALCWQ